MVLNRGGQKPQQQNQRVFLRQSPNSKVARACITAEQGISIILSSSSALHIRKLWDGTSADGLSVSPLSVREGVDFLCFFFFPYLAENLPAFGMHHMGSPRCAAQADNSSHPNLCSCPTGAGC